MVDFILLIIGFIFVKKLVEGLDVLVMDVKVGSGVFMLIYEFFEVFVEVIVGVVNGVGVCIMVLLIDMNQVLVLSVGNVVEVCEVVQFLIGEYCNLCLFDVIMVLCVEMLIFGQLVKDDVEVCIKLQVVLDNGKVVEVFGCMVVVQKGLSDFVENYDKYLLIVMLSKVVYVDIEGFISVMDMCVLGMVVVLMGGGCCQVFDIIDYSVGFIDMVCLGDSIDGQCLLVVIYVKDEVSWQEVVKVVKVVIIFDDKVLVSIFLVYC